MSKRAACLENLIREGGIEFFNGERKIELPLDDFGSDDAHLLRSITDHSSTYLTIKGKRLGRFLSKQRNLNDFLEFLLGMWFFTYCGIETEETRKELKIHVSADIERLSKHYRPYPQPLAADSVNYFTSKRKRAALWLPGMPEFEKEWNLTLDTCFGGLVGTGHEGIFTEGEFERRIAYYMQYFLVGTKRQLSRYEQYAQKFPEYAQGINHAVKGFL
jgi:hypothetical protein